jgi:hypothetical protein
VIDVPISRPRTIETLGSPAFNAICNRLRMFFRAQAGEQGKKS